MFQKCFLHVGNPHAGSTSIQGALFDHAAQLREDGFLYPSSHRNHGALAADKAPQSRRAQAILTREQRAADPDTGLDDICRAFRAEVEAEMAASDAHTLLLSSEFFCTLPMEELQALQRYLSRFAEQVVVVCYTRHPYAEYLTRIQHRVKRGRGRIEQFSRDAIQGNIVDRLDKLVEAFGREQDRLLAVGPRRGSPAPRVAAGGLGGGSGATGHGRDCTGVQKIAHSYKP